MKTPSAKTVFQKNDGRETSRRYIFHDDASRVAPLTCDYRRALKQKRALKNRTHPIDVVPLVLVPSSERVFVFPARARRRRWILLKKPGARARAATAAPTPASAAAVCVSCARPGTAAPAATAAAANRAAESSASARGATAAGVALSKTKPVPL